MEIRKAGKERSISPLRLRASAGDVLLSTAAGAVRPPCGIWPGFKPDCVAAPLCGALAQPPWERGRLALRSRFGEEWVPAASVHRALLVGASKSLSVSVSKGEGRSENTGDYLEIRKTGMERSISPLCFLMFLISLFTSLYF